MNKYIAEFVGTFALVFAGCGAISSTDLIGQPGHIGISLVVGLVVMAMICRRWRQTKHSVTTSSFFLTLVSLP